MEGSGARQASDVKPKLKSYITKAYLLGLGLARVRACVRVCERVCVRMCVRVCVRVVCEGGVRGWCVSECVRVVW